MKNIKIGIIICDRYHTCAGGKCFRALQERVGAFYLYAGKPAEIVAYTTCGGCPGGNVEYAPEEMIKNGVDVIHLATGLVVGYPPCPRIAQFEHYIETRYKIPVVIGTHPIPEKYYLVHTELGTWKSERWQGLLGDLQDTPETRKAYD